MRYMPWSKEKYENRSGGRLELEQRRALSDLEGVKTDDSFLYPLD